MTGNTEHLVADVLLEHVGGCDVYRQVEDLSSLAAKSSKVDEGAAWLQVYEEIHVTYVGGFPACEGPESTQMSDAVLLGCVE